MEAPSSKKMSRVNKIMVIQCKKRETVKFKLIKFYSILFYSYATFTLSSLLYWIFTDWADFILVGIDSDI